MKRCLAKSIKYFKPSLKLVQQNAGILIISLIILIAAAAVATATPVAAATAVPASAAVATSAAVLLPYKTAAFTYTDTSKIFILFVYVVVCLLAIAQMMSFFAKSVWSTSNLQ